MQLTENTYFGEGDRYCLERLLGRGGFSEVWLIKDTLTDTEDALKVYAPGTGMDNDGLKMFTKELSLVHNIHHTHILTASYVGVWQNMPYLVMPYCPKGSLVSRVGSLTEEEAWRLIRESCAGLSYLHGQAEPIIHQDIKPDNILIDVLGNYVITDFGISTRSQSTLRKSVRNVSSGTSAYMGPERFGQSPLPIKASDIWALGATIFELIEGYVPFGELGGLAQKSGADMPLIQANVSDPLKNVIYSMLAKETWDRPTASELVERAKTPHVVEQNRTTMRDSFSTRIYDGSRETQRFESSTTSDGKTMPASQASTRSGRWLPILLLLLCLPYTFYLNILMIGGYKEWGRSFFFILISLLLFLSIDCCLITLVRAPQMKFYKVLNYLIPIGAFFLLLSFYFMGFYGDLLSSLLS